MSQEKVARYKEEKANRKVLMKKAKRKAVLSTTIASVVAVGVLGWFGYSVTSEVLERQPRKSVMIDYGAIEDYTTALNAEEAK